MPRAFFKYAIAAALLFIAGCSSRTDAPATPVAHRVTQFSIINALMLGHYDGFVSMRDMLRDGNFGLGACDALDGELIVLDGQAYQANADGTVAKLSADAKTPFAIVTAFQATGSLRCPSVESLEELEARLDEQLTSRDFFYAVRADAEFKSITFRSVPKQTPPYRPLVEVSQDQQLHTHENILGTLVAFRTPKWAETLGVPGYHWHFISRNRKFGGHVMRCEIVSGNLEFDRCDSWLVKLPDTLGAGGKDVSADLRGEVDQVERVRSDTAAPALPDGAAEHERNKR